MTPRPLWTIETMTAAMRAGARRSAAPIHLGNFDRYPHHCAGQSFFAIKGENRDGHDFVEAAHKAGAGLAVWMRTSRADLPAMPPSSLFPMCSKDCASWRGPHAGARRRKSLR